MTDTTDSLQNRVDDYLDQAFAAFDDSPAVADLRIELRHDLLERLLDLTSHGVEPEVAYAQVIASVGDISTTIAEVVAHDQAYAKQSTGSTTQTADQATPTPAAPTPETTPGATPPSSATPPDPSASFDATEPNGPAESLNNPTSAPGATYTETTAPGFFGAGSATGSAYREYGSADSGPASQPEQDWAAKLTEAITAGVETARTQILNALDQVDDATSKAGDWEERVRQAMDTGLRSALGENRVFVRGVRRAANKSRVSYTASTFRDADFRGQSLPEATFTASSMRGSDFTGAILTEARFTASDLRAVNFTRADLTRAHLKSCSLREAIFDATILTGANLSSASMRGVSFIGCTLNNVRAKYSDLRDSRFADCAMDSVDFTGADLRGARFDGLVLTNVSFEMSNVTSASFRGSILRNVSFRHVSSRVVQSMICADTVVDRATFTSLQSTGRVPEGIRVEA
ncbi:MAG: pentapeptide repeat-containing protein [Propionibacteriaceae bacterium]|jgi:uncharacterized protein YjbI with pentapeptide repeats|nr:pentapeptide repeat-containing protein [Propionibacteriaceae bacterium]